MATDLQVKSAQFGRGLHLTAAPEVMEEGQARVLRNWRTLGTGRVSTRKAARLFAPGEQPVLAVVAYAAVAGVAALRFTYEALSDDPITGRVNLWTLNAQGVATLIGPLAGWTGVLPEVRIHVAVLATIVFIVDEGREHGLTIWDPNSFLQDGEGESFGESGPGAGGPLFQPLFVFDPDGPESLAVPSPLRGNYILEHLNHLWVFGYGSETDPDRPEYARFSYLGLVADDGGLGDAGATPGSENLFDIEDVVPIFSRGERVVAASSAPGRMVICSEREAHVVYGTDRESWRKDKIDSQRGCVNSYAMGEADGAAWWLSPIGVCRYRGGGRVEDLTEGEDGGSIRPLLKDLDCELVFFAHAYDEAHARFYYRRLDDTLEGADRSANYDYRARTWSLDVLGGRRVTCAGYVRPSILEPPIGAPANLRHIHVSSSSATAAWDAGDPTPGVRTRVFLTAPGESARLVATLEDGTSRYTHTGLLPLTTYTTTIQEIRNGVSLGTLAASFTTLAAGAVVIPTQISLVNQAYFSGGQWRPGVAISWTWGGEPHTLLIERSLDFSSGFQQIAAVGAASSFHHDRDVVSGLWYYYQFRARNTLGDLTGYVGPVPIFVTLATTNPENPGTGDEPGGGSPPPIRIFDEE